jgi:hypothetical protein
MADLKRRRVLVGAVAGVMAAVAALAVAFAVWDPGGETTAPDGAPPITARATFSPRAVLFGDTVRAIVEASLDTTRIDPDSLRVTADFLPWRVIARPRRVRRDEGERTHVRTTFLLRCLAEPCIPTGQSAQYEPDPVRIAYTAVGEGAQGPGSIEVPFPPLRMYTRLSSNVVRVSRNVSTPWRADLLTLPQASYRIAPGLLTALFLGGAVIFGLGAVGLAYVAWPRRAPAPPPEPEPELPPEPGLSPLEQALALLEESVRRDGAADQRRALELVAEELELAEWGDRDLARRARALAWSKGIPPVAQTVALAERVRASLPPPEPEPETEDSEVGEHVV